MNDFPLVTIVMPVRNEALHLDRAIAAIGVQNWPLTHLEVVVVDGSSSDGSAAVAEEALARYAFARSRVLTDPIGTTPRNLNRGLAAATGEVVCRVDARSVVSADHVRRCVEVLSLRSDVVVCGGAQRAEAVLDGAGPAGIARALNNRWTTGFSKYRRGGCSGPSDTVYLGAFRRGDLQSVGGWDESLGTNQDFDLNRRLGEVGLVWYVQGLETGYVPRADHQALFRQYRRFGAAKVGYWRLTGDRPRPRQVAALGVVPAAAVAVLAGIAAPRSARAAAGITVALVAIVAEGIGTTGPDAGVAGRAWALAATACIWVGWSYGAWTAILNRDGAS